MNVKVYNIAKFIEKELPDKRVYMLNKVAIVEGKHGVVVFDYEAVGWKKNTVNATIEVGLTDIPEPNTFFCMPQYYADISIKELMEAEFEEMPITQFVERFDTHHRVKRNYEEILDAINYSNRQE